MPGSKWSIFGTSCRPWKVLGACCRCSGKICCCCCCCGCCCCLSMGKFEVLGWKNLHPAIVFRSLHFFIHSNNQINWIVSWIPNRSNKSNLQVSPYLHSRDLLLFTCIGPASLICCAIENKFLKTNIQG